MNTNKLRTRVLRLTLFAVALSIPAFSQTTGAPSAASKSIPVVDGGIGPCSAEFTVTDAAGAPVYAASIKVHIAYRFMSAHKLDLEVGTNSDGKARFTGLPNRLKRGLYFETAAPKHSTIPRPPAKRNSPSLCTRNPEGAQNKILRGNRWIAIRQTVTAKPALSEVQGRRP
jgi:hypothetical protein